MEKLCWECGERIDKCRCRRDPVKRPVMTNADRNKPCPCGSGRKWKKCCGTRGS